MAEIVEKSHTLIKSIRKTRNAIILHILCHEKFLKSLLKAQKWKRITKQWNSFFCRNDCSTLGQEKDYLKASKTYVWQNTFLPLPVGQIQNLKYSNTEKN